MRKSLWSPDEDEKLRRYVATHGCGNWSDVAKQTGLQRCGKSCRLRWINYLRPDLKRGPFSAHEVRLVVNLHNSLGNSWSKIATHLPGRTDNDVKNFWHSYTRSRRMQQQQQQQHADSSRKKDELKCGDKSLSKSQAHYCRSDNEEDTINRADASYADNLLHAQPHWNQQLAMADEQPRRAGSNESLLQRRENLQTYNKPTAPYHIFTALSHKSAHPIALTDPANRISLSSYSHHPDSHLHLPASQSSGGDYPPTVSAHKPLSDLHAARISALYRDYHPNIIHNQTTNSCNRDVTPLSFQHFPPLMEASDPTNLRNSQPARSHLDENSCCTVRMRGNNALNGGLYAQAPGSVAMVTQAGRSLAADNTSAKDELPADLIKPPEGLESVIWSFLKKPPCIETGAAAEYTSDHHANCNAGEADTASRAQIYSNLTEKALFIAPNHSLPSDNYPNYQLVAPDQTYINIFEPDYTSPDNKRYMQPHFLADCLS